MQQDSSYEPTDPANVEDSAGSGAVQHDDCRARRPFLTVNEFFPFAASMRTAFDVHFSDPYGRAAARQQIWDYWFVPDLYAYFRTDPKRVFLPALVDCFMEALSRWCAYSLGLGKVSYPHLSLYINGCGQGMHNDSCNGRLGYVFSLTNWDARRFAGGETLILSPDRYWHSPRITRAAAGPPLYELVPPLFNQLLVFDDRLPHAVRPLQGNMDPLDGRLVLHGHICEGGVLVEGNLTTADIRAAIAVAEHVLADVPDLAGLHGVIALRMHISADGTTHGIRVLCNRLLPTVPTAGDPGRVARDIAKKLGTLTFPERSGTSTITIPIVLTGDKVATISI